MLYWLFNTLVLFQNDEKEKPFRKDDFSRGNADWHRLITALKLPTESYFQSTQKVQNMNPCTINVRGYPCR